MELPKPINIKVQKVEDEDSTTVTGTGTGTGTCSESDPESDPGYESDSSAVVDESLKRKSKTTAKNVVAKRSKHAGELALLLEMPIEIFTKVACHMSPEDLLSLARTSIKLRNFLMSKSSKRIWQAARTAYDSDMPPCPSDLSEPQYAELLFGKCCTLCGESSKTSLYVSLRARLCARCKSEKLVSTKGIVLTKRKINPCSLLPYIGSDNVKRQTITFVVADHLKELERKLVELSSDEQALRVYLSQRRELVKTIRKSSSEIRWWLDDERTRQEDHKKELMEARRTCIEEKLRALGYDEEDCNSDFDPIGSEWNSLVKQTRPLTDREWRTIKPQLEEMIKFRRVHANSQLQPLRRGRRKNEMMSHFRKHRPQISTLPFGQLFSGVELFEVPSVNQAIEEDEFRIPVTDERWSRVASCFPEFVIQKAKKFERTCVEETIEGSRHEFEFIDATMTHSSVENEVDFQLAMSNDIDVIPKCLLTATAFFGSTSKPRAYQELLHHKSVDGVDSIQFRCLPSETSSRELFLMAEELLRYLKLPKDTSMSYMLACGKVFRCLACTRIGQTSSMDWSELVVHFCLQCNDFRRLEYTAWDLKLNVPLRNDHDLDNSPITLIKRVTKTTVDMPPTYEPAERYSALSASWGLPLVNKVAEDSITDESDGEEEEEGDDRPLSYAYCIPCRSFYKAHAEINRRGMRKHMRLCHGTDSRGKPLPGLDTTSLQLQEMNLKEELNHETFRSHLSSWTANIQSHALGYGGTNYE